MADTFQNSDTMQEFLSSEYYKQALEQFKASKKPKKEWEIVAFKHRGKIAALIEDWREGFSQPHFKYPRQMMSLSWALNPANDCTIHSVRRLSDGETLNVLDWVKTTGSSKRQITGFSIVENGLLIHFNNGSLNIVPGGPSLAKIEKLSAPILVTHDGEEVYDWKDFHPAIVFPDFDIKANASEDYWIEAKAGYPESKLFSTREAAEEYILNHKPLLSLNDVREALPEQYWLSKATVIDRLTALVKEKVLTEGIDYEVKEDYACSRHTYLHPDEKCDGSTVALPIVNKEPITEDELWASAIELYLKAKSLYPFSPEKWVSTVQQKYSLTKKQHHP